jgi:hypothetical protein
MQMSSLAKDFTDYDYALIAGRTKAPKPRLSRTIETGLKVARGASSPPLANPRSRSTEKCNVMRVKTLRLFEIARLLVLFNNITGGGNTALGFNAVIRVYDEAGNVIETHEHEGEFKEA